MKKVVLVGVVAIFGLTSCSKEYTCKCTAVYDDGSTVVQTEDYFNISESQAKTNCENKANEIYISKLNSGFKTNVQWIVSVK